MITRIRNEQDLSLITYRDGEDFPLPAFLYGSLVRYYPSIDSDDEQIKKIKDQFIERGVIEVKVMPRPSRAPIKTKNKKAHEGKSIRQIAIEMAKKVEDKRSLVGVESYVHNRLDSVGL